MHLVPTFHTLINFADDQPSNLPRGYEKVPASSFRRCTVFEPVLPPFEEIYYNMLAQNPLEHNFSANAPQLRSLLTDMHEKAVFNDARDIYGLVAAMEISKQTGYHVNHIPPPRLYYPSFKEVTGKEDPEPGSLDPPKTPKRRKDSVSRAARRRRRFQEFNPTSPLRMEVRDGSDEGDDPWATPTSAEQVGEVVQEVQELRFEDFVNPEYVEEQEEEEVQAALPNLGGWEDDAEPGESNAWANDAWDGGDWKADGEVEGEVWKRKDGRESMSEIGVCVTEEEITAFNDWSSLREVRRRNSFDF